MSKKKLTLCVFIDAFGWEILQHHRFLDDELTTKAPLGTVLGYSSTCIPTILTGRMPREHGHLSFFRYDPENSPFAACRCLKFLPKSITRRGRVRRMMSKAIQKFYGYTGYFQIYNMPFDYLPLFDYSEKRDLYQPGGINSGAETIFDHLRERRIDFYLSDWRVSEDDNFASLEKSLDEGQVEFAYLYLAAMDGVLHAHGTESPAVTDKITWYEQGLRRALRLAERKYDEVSLFIFSDHGMTDITEECDLMSEINRLGLRFGVDYAAMYDSTMARFWFLKDTAREKITRALRNESRGRILYEADLQDYGVDFASREYGELFFLMNPGVLLCPSFMGETALAGMHGFDAYDKDSVAMFASNIAMERLPRRLDDLYSVMTEAVGSEQCANEPSSGERQGGDASQEIVSERGTISQSAPDRTPTIAHCSLPAAD